MRFGLTVAAIAAAVCVSGGAIAHQSYYEYYITAHNHFGETVYFSCNGGTPREIHDDQSRTINFHGEHDTSADCVATHDGQVVWNEHYHMGDGNRSIRIVISASHDHQD